MARQNAPGSNLLGCYRCAYVWRPRRNVCQLCPRCKSRSWNTPILKPIRYGRRAGIPEIIGPKREEIIRAARNYNAHGLRVFGSVARSDATRESDVDLLVDLEAEVTIYDLVALRDELSRILHRKVDLVTERGLHWLARPQILFEAVPL